MRDVGRHGADRDRSVSVADRPQLSRGELGRWAVRGAGLGIGLITIAALALVAQASANVIVLVLVALLLAAAIDPLVAQARRRTGLSRAKVIALVYVSLAAIAILLVVLITPAFTDELSRMSGRLPQIMNNGREWASSLEPAILGTVLSRLIDTLETTFTRSGVTSPDPQTIVAFGLSAADAALAVLSVMTMVYFWLISRQTIQRFVLSMMTLERRREVRAAWNQIEERVGFWLRGQLTLMTIIGSASTIAYVALGLPNALLLGLFAGIAEVIPIIGPAIGAVPALIAAFVMGGPQLLLAVLIVYVVIQVVEGQFLTPIVMRNAVGLPPFFIIVSLLVGGAIAGIGGALLAVPVGAAIVVVLENAQARQRAVHLHTPDFTDQEAEDDATDPAADTEETTTAMADAAGAPVPPTRHGVSG